MTAPQLLELDAGAERSVSRLRAVAAVLVGASSVALLAGPTGTLGVVIGLLGLGASVGWIFAYRSSGMRVAHREDYFLRLDDEGVTLSLGEKRESARWKDVVDGHVNEDRLMLELDLRDGSRLDIPPIFRAFGIYELEDLVNERRHPATPPEDSTDPPSKP